MRDQRLLTSFLTDTDSYHAVDSHAISDDDETDADDDDDDDSLIRMVTSPTVLTVGPMTTIMTIMLPIPANVGPALQGPFQFFHSSERRI